jgi:hypothetical protein
VSGLVPQALLRPHLGIVVPGVSELVRQLAFSLFHVAAEDAEVGTALTTGGYGTGSGKDQPLAAPTFKGDAGRVPLVDLAERDFASLVVRFDALDDLRYGLLPFPAARRIHRRLTKDSVWCLCY